MPNWNLYRVIDAHILKIILSYYEIFFIIIVHRLMYMFGCKIKMIFILIQYVRNIFPEKLSFPGILKIIMRKTDSPEELNRNACSIIRKRRLQLPNYKMLKKCCGHKMFIMLPRIDSARSYTYLKQCVRNISMYSLKNRANVTLQSNILGQMSTSI